MTIEIVEFRCPTCGHAVGEEEYKHACNTFDRKVSEACSKQIESIKIEYEAELRNIERKHQDEFDSKVAQETQVILKQEKEMMRLDYNKRVDKEKAIISENYARELQIKNKEIEIAKSQSLSNIDEKIRQALETKEEKHNQTITEYKLRLSRVEGDHKNLVKHAEHLQKTLDNIPPELRGTAGENNLYDMLKSAFGQDILVSKKVGVEMPDVVQTIVLESGERIPTPIAWDMKTGDSITPKDIEKAKRYKEICNTDCSIIVSAKGITAKDSERDRPGLIGYREGILLVHPSVVVGIAKLMRTSLIEKSTYTKSSTGRHSKQAKLFDYMNSQSRFRKMRDRIEKKSKLEESIRRAEDYMKKSWGEQKKAIQSWFETDQNDEKTINDIIQEETDFEEEGAMRE